MFSTFAKVENVALYVGNHRKNGVFTWKSVSEIVENRCVVENAEPGNPQRLVRTGFWRLLDKSCSGMEAHGKPVEKIFLNMEKYVENVSKPCKIVIFRASEAEKDGF